MKEEDFFPIGSDKFDEYLMFLNFNKGINVKRERFDKKTKLALIFDESVQDSLKLDEIEQKEVDEFENDYTDPEINKGCTRVRERILSNIEKVKEYAINDKMIPSNIDIKSNFPLFDLRPLFISMLVLHCSHTGIENE